MRFAVTFQRRKFIVKSIDTDEENLDHADLGFVGRCIHIVYIIQRSIVTDEENLEHAHLGFARRCIHIVYIPNNQEILPR